MNWHLDWAGVLTGQPLQWIISGFLTTLYVTLAASLLATLLTLLLLVLRLAPGRVGRGVAAVYVSIFRNTPLLVQLLFWYFAAYHSSAPHGGPQRQSAAPASHPHWLCFPAI